MFFTVHTISIFTGKLSKQENLNDFDELSTYLATDRGAWVLVEASNGASILMTWGGEKYENIFRFKDAGVAL
jgi:hypothetical protein